MSGNRITLGNHTELFKEYYIPIAEAAINTSTPFRTMIRRIKNFTGKQITGVARLSRGSGVGNAVIPRGSTRKSKPINYTPKALWATSVLDWEAMVSSGDDRGAFVNVTVDEVEGCLEGYTANESRQCFGTSAGILGALDGTAPVDNGDGTWTFIISAATWFYPKWEEGYIINFHTNTDPFEILQVTKGTRTIKVERLDGSFDPSTLTNQNLYMQNSRNEELTGLQEICDATEALASTLYGLAVQNRWAARRYDGGSKPLVPDMLVEMCALQEEDTGVDYSAIILNTVQMTSLENQLEGKKEYTQLKSNDSRYADMGWEALTLSVKGKKIPLITDLFCPKDRVYFITKDKMEMRERPKFGWADFDGKNFLRDFQEGQKPMYKALYGGYEQFFHHPAYAGVIHTLEVPSVGGA